MYEVHGWFSLSESVQETDLGGLSAMVRQIERMLTERSYGSLLMVVQVLNGQYYLTITGNMNRRREEAVLMDDVLEFVRQVLPGSFGLLYERDDEMSSPPGGNAFRVTTLARGEFAVRQDTFLSPCVPVIEE